MRRARILVGSRASSVWCTEHSVAAVEVFQTQNRIQNDARAGDIQSWCDVYFPYMYLYYMHTYVVCTARCSCSLYIVHLYNADNVVVEWWGVVSFGIYISHSSEESIFDFSACRC